MRTQYALNVHEPWSSLSHSSHLLFSCHPSTTISHRSSTPTLRLVSVLPFCTHLRPFLHIALPLLTPTPFPLHPTAQPSKSLPRSNLLPSTPTSPPPQLTPVQTTLPLHSPRKLFPYLQSYPQPLPHKSHSPQPPPSLLYLDSLAKQLPKLVSSLSTGTE